MSEKLLRNILFSVAGVAILIVILVSIPWGGDKGRIMREYDSLEDRNHVFVTISFDDLMNKINKGETFQVYVGSSTIPECEQFVFEANKLAKQNGIDTIYYLNYANLNEDQITQVKIKSNLSITFPTLIYWENDGATSTAFHISSLKELANYDSNWSILLTEYFEDCKE